MRCPIRLRTSVLRFDNATDVINHYLWNLGFKLVQVQHSIPPLQLRAFGINADQWTTAAQDEGEWRRTTEQGAEHFMAKWIVAEKTKAGLRHAVVCPNVGGRTKERIAQSKRARAGSLALVG